MKPAFRLNRRTLLRGAGGIAVALPALDIMQPRLARAAGQPRFVLAYGGVSTGAYQARDQLVPDMVGPGYDVKRALKPLADMNIRDDVSVVTGLVIPWSVRDTEAVPPGGRSRFFHFNTVGPLIAGTSTPKERAGAPRGPTADQIVADRIAGTTQHRVLLYRVQAAAEYSEAGRLSWRRDGAGKLVTQDPISSPRLAYQSLFSSFTPPSGPPMVDDKVRRLLESRKSVLDFVSGEANGLMMRLGAADRARMQRHFDEVRALEMRLSAGLSAGGTAAASCTKPAQPMTDPPISSGGNWGYNGEEVRGDVMTDLIAMAFACDLSRVASFMITEWKCYMNMKSLIGHDSDMHELTHGAGPLESISDSVAWIVKQWGKLIVKLKAVKEPDGRTLLDSTALVLVFEGGHGFDPEGNRTLAAHSTENMSALIAGRAGGLKPGKHIAMPNGHPAQVVLSAMNGAGVTDTKLGDVSGNVPGLFS
jgi:hypothetical protein